MNLETKINKKKKQSQNKIPKISIEGSFARVKLSGSLLKLSSLYSVKRTWILILIITFISFVSAVIGVFFLQNTGLYNVGFEAFAQGFARLVAFVVDGDINFKNNIMNALFWGLIIVVNIPLIFFGWYKIGKRFTLFSTYYIVVSSLIGLSLGYIPGIDKVFLFAKTTSLDEFVNAGVQISLWNSQHDSISQLSLFIYGFIYGLVQAICYAILFILGSSSGGLDFIVVWYAEKKYKNLGTIFTYFNILCFIISYAVGTFVTSSITIEKYGGVIADNFGLDDNIIPLTVVPWSLDLFFSPNFAATMLMSIVLGITLNAFFPKYQMSKVEIISRYVNEIRDAVIAENKPYSLSIKTVEGGYSKLPQKMLVTVCMYVDAAYLLELVRKYDPNALFTVVLIKSVDGYVYVSSKNEEHINLFSILKKFFKKKSNETEEDIYHKIEFEVDDNLIDKTSEINETENEEINVIEASEVYDETLENKNNEEK